MLASSARIAAPQPAREPRRLVVSRTSTRSARSRPTALRATHHATTAAASAPAVLAVFAGVGSGVVVFGAARISFDRPRDRGLIGEPMLWLVVLILIVTVIAGTLIGRSFRAGLETAVLAWLAVYLCTLAVEIPQALAWYHDEGILLLDGEPAGGVDARGAALQPITHFGFIFLSASQLVIAVLAAGGGAMLLSHIGRGRRLMGDSEP